MTFEVEFHENNNTLSVDFGVLHFVEGADGFSPIATVEQTDEGATITITDKNGTTSATVKNGEDGLPGQDGSDGQNGVSCTHSWGGENGTILTVSSASGLSSADLKGADGVGITDISCYESTESGGTNQVNISTSDGRVHNFYIRNGEKGEQGLPGADGKDGHSPVRGVDYWTEADKAEMKSYIDGTSSKTGIIEISNLGEIKTNKVYSLMADAAQILPLKWLSIDTSFQNQILVYLNAINTIEIVWGDDVAFVNDEIPTINAGCYRIILEYNPVLNKWVVGVIQDGAVN